MEQPGPVVLRGPLDLTDEKGVPHLALGHEVDLQRLEIEAGPPSAAGWKDSSITIMQQEHYVGGA
jgi:hypothetical protein